MVKFEVSIFVRKNGKQPFDIWFSDLDVKTQSRISQRISNIQAGNFGNSKPLQGGVWELKFDFGPGYRIYYGKEKNKIIILLSGGDKSSQKKDIEKAKEYWSEYLND